MLSPKWSGGVVSIVSHGHENYIFNNESLVEISRLPSVKVAIKDNLNSSSLKEYCLDNDFLYITSKVPAGFGENNNIVFDYCKSKGMLEDNWFFVINPDVEIDIENFKKLTTVLSQIDFKICTVNLFKDMEYTISEESLRHYPSLKSLANLLLGKQVTKSYDKEFLEQLSPVEWASGAFLVIRSELYSNLKGFDTSYHMYYEDVDLCYRARQDFNENVRFIKDVNAMHVGAYRNRDIFSRHFVWYVKSLMRFLFKLK